MRDLWQDSQSPWRMMSRLKDLRRPRRPPSDDFTTTGLFGLSDGSFIGIEETEGEVGRLDFEPLERADVRIDNKGLLAIIRRAMLGDDGALCRRSRRI